jgi:hypothetical protein
LTELSPIEGYNQENEIQKLRAKLNKAGLLATAQSLPFCRYLILAKNVVNGLLKREFPVSTSTI